MKGGHSRYFRKLSNKSFPRSKQKLCCGLYFPGLGTQRGKYIPEDVRATLMNIFRIGLNLIVVGVLYNIHTLFDYVWVLSAFLLGIAAIAQHILHDMTTGSKSEQAAAMAEYQGGYGVWRERARMTEVAVETSLLGVFCLLR